MTTESALNVPSNVFLKDRTLQFSFSRSITSFRPAVWSQLKAFVRMAISCEIGFGEGKLASIFHQLMTVLADHNIKERH